MCTVTYVRKADKIFLTSNRDEKHFRSPASPPDVYPMKSGNILFPRDRDGGGTWISLHENGNAVVFLNGGFVKHVPKPPYRKSRGLVLLGLADTSSPREAFMNADFDNIEPFTAVIWDNSRLFECRWDAENRHSKELNAAAPHIWSSVTLYDEEVIVKRKKWFNNWLKQHPDPCLNDILHFHQFSGDGDKRHDLMMNRDGLVYTVSITGMQLNHTGGCMQYIDLRIRENSFRQLDFCKAIPVR